MARGESSQRRARPAGVVRRFLSGTVLLTIGGSVGIVVGTLWNVPEILLARLLQPVQRIDLARDAAELSTGPLPGFESLQRGIEGRRARVPARAAKPPVSAAPRPPPRAASPKQRAAEEVIADLAARSGAPGEGAVVQVASYTDRRAADALVRRLRAGGFESFLSDTRPGGTRRYRVRVRPRPGRDPKILAARLAREGFSVWVTNE